MGTESEKLFSICERKKTAVKRSVRAEGQGEARPQKTGSYQVSNDFLEKLGAFLHLVFWTSQLDDVALLRRVGEIDNDLEGSGMIITKLHYS